MAMRGDDVIAVRESDDGQHLEIMKGETKSRAALNAGVLTEARSSLDRDGGLPSPMPSRSSTTRVREIGEIGLADKIDDAQYKRSILANQVCHFLLYSAETPQRTCCAPISTLTTAHSTSTMQALAFLRIKHLSRLFT